MQSKNAKYVIMAYFHEFISTFQEIYEILPIDAFKSHDLTAIAGCFSTVHFRYRIHQINFVFTIEALAIMIAIDELTWSGHLFLFLTVFISSHFSLRGNSFVSQSHTMVTSKGKPCFDTDI